jgi:FHA domain
MRKISLILLGLLLLAGQGNAVRAQSAATADLMLVDAQGFPTVAALLDVFDEGGQPITGLGAKDVTVLEDNQPHPVNKLVESTPPAQIMVAINPGPALAVRDGEGVERIGRVKEVLTGWAGAQPTEDPDDLSLVSIAGPIITHANPDGWAISLNAFQPDFRSTTPNVQLLSVALNTINEDTPLPGIKRAILLITPHMDDTNIEQQLNDIAEQATASKVRIFVWFVDSDQYFNTPSATAFQALALQTGGAYFAFSGREVLPDPETYFAPLRHLYSLSYDSTLTTSGAHNIAVAVETPTGAITSESQSFNLDVQPPNPILVLPPAQIVRQAPQDDPFNSELLLPEKQEIEIIIEFPDNHPRPLARTTLYVDGQLVDQNESEPFDAFVWDLSEYTESNEHSLVVEVVDNLGMSKASMGVPVTVTIVHPPTGPQAFLARYRLYIATGAIIVAGSILIIVLLSGRLRIRSRRERRADRKRDTDPVTQPVIIRQAEAPTKKKQAVRAPWSRGWRERLQDAPAYLTRLREDGEPMTGNPIPMVEREITFGTDPVQATHVLDDSSIATLHARLKRTDSGEFLLLDNSSVAGTWVNYDSVPQGGRILKHGDMVHFGQLLYRFSLKNPPADAEPKIIPEAPAE